MNTRFPSSQRSQRSKEAPMDYQWTNRSPVKPVWAKDNDDPSTPRKRSHDALNPSTPSLLTTPQQPTFGSNQHIPFLFQPAPIPQTPQTHPWVPPPQFSPSKAFPQNEVADIDMAEVTPSKTGDKATSDETWQEREIENERPVAAGALRRVYKQRAKRQESRAVATRRPSGEDGDDPSRSGSESDDNGAITPMAQNTSNHYTLNMPAPAAPQSDLPFVLLGYLQFFFNLSLILIFLYLFVQFILTVQRDVEHRIAEYSQDIIQDISMCSTQFKNNFCAGNIAPAMVQQCANWETCMNRDPKLVGRAKVGAELIAEVVNGFVEPISWKTLMFTLTSLAFLTVFVNTLLSLYRAKHQPILDASPHHPPPSFPIAPATPFPPHHFGGYLSPAPTPNWARYRNEQDLESPTRKRKLLSGGAAKVK